MVSLCDTAILDVTWTEVNGRRGFLTCMSGFRLSHMSGFRLSILLYKGPDVTSLSQHDACSVQHRGWLTAICTLFVCFGCMDVIEVLFEGGVGGIFPKLH